MKRIPMKNSSQIVVAHALVDDEDYDEAMAVGAWCFVAQGYVGCSKTISRNQLAHLLLHRFVMGFNPRDPEVVDHRDRNKLNNQKSNLRIITKGQNSQNRPGQPRGTSLYRGVYWNTQRQRWYVRHKVDGKQFHIGCFIDEEEANAAAIAWRKINMPYNVEPETPSAKMRQSFSGNTFLPLATESGNY